MHVRMDDPNSWNIYKYTYNLASILICQSASAACGSCKTVTNNTSSWTNFYVYILCVWLVSMCNSCYPLSFLIMMAAWNSWSLPIIRKQRYAPFICTLRSIIITKNGSTSLSSTILHPLLFLPNCGRHFGQKTPVAPLSTGASRIPNYRPHAPDGSAHPPRAGCARQAVRWRCPSTIRYTSYYISDIAGHGPCGPSGAWPHLLQPPHHGCYSVPDLWSVGHGLCQLRAILAPDA